jgi:hypothetical protein
VADSLAETVEALLLSSTEGAQLLAVGVHPGDEALHVVGGKGYVVVPVAKGL